jgi:hypothetical protein
LENVTLNAVFLNQAQLSHRWRISVRSLEKWRSLGKGPPFVKIGGCVRYKLTDIEAWEREQTHIGIADDDQGSSE